MHLFIIIRHNNNLVMIIFPLSSILPCYLAPPTPSSYINCVFKNANFSLYKRLDDINLDALKW